MGWKEREAELAAGTSTSPSPGWKAREAELANEFPITDLGEKRQSQMEAAKTFATNIGRGATLGLVKYPAALAQMGVRALTGAPVGTFGENVADVGEFYRQQEAASPTAATAGRVIGGLVPIPGLGPATTVLGTAGRGAVSGGVSGFTEQENLSDALKGAAVGGGVGLVGGTLASAYAKPAEAFVRSRFEQKMAERIEKNAPIVATELKNLQPAFDRITMRAGRSVDPDNVVKYIADYGSKNNPLRKAGIRITEAEVDAAKSYNAALGQVKGADTRIQTAAKMGPAEFYDYAKGSLGYKALQGGQSYLQAAKEMLPGIALGAGAGAGMGMMSGMTPMQGAAMGAGMGGLYELKARGAPFITQAAAAGLSRMAPTGAIPRAVSQTAAQQMATAPTEIEPDEVPDTRSRLQRLADDFRSRNTGQ